MLRDWLKNNFEEVSHRLGVTNKHYNVELDGWQMVAISAGLQKHGLYKAEGDRLASEDNGLSAVDVRLEAMKLAEKAKISFDRDAERAGFEVQHEDGLLRTTAKSFINGTQISESRSGDIEYNLSRVDIHPLTMHLGQ